MRPLREADESKVPNRTINATIVASWTLVGILALLAITALMAIRFGQLEFELGFAYFLRVAVFLTFITVLIVAYAFTMKLPAWEAPWQQVEAERNESVDSDWAEDNRPRHPE